MASGSEHLRPNLHAYLVAHSSPPDALLRDLVAETAQRFPDRVIFQIGPEQGTFMTMLASLMGARQVVEVGTFTGYSSLCLARGLGRGREATVLRCQRGVDVAGPRLLAEGGHGRPHRTAARPGPGHAAHAARGPVDRPGPHRRRQDGLPQLLGGACAAYPARRTRAGGQHL